MARGSVGIRLAVACTVFSAFLLAAGSAQAEVGGPVDDAVGGGGAAGDTVEEGLDDTVDQVTDSSQPLLEDTVQKVTKPAGPSSQEAPSGARDDGSRPSRGAAEAQRDVPRVGSQPQDDPGTAAVDTSATAPPKRQKARSGHAVRERAAAEGRARQGAGAHPPDVPACKSGSLAIRDLRRCARAGTSLRGPVPDIEVRGKTASTSLPGLGGVPDNLLPAGLVMVGLGLVLVACGRRRGALVGPAT